MNDPFVITLLFIAAGIVLVFAAAFLAAHVMCKALIQDEWLPPNELEDIDK